MFSQDSDLTAKARIREAAIALFSERGFDVSLRAVAEAAGVSPALVVHHFGSREGLRAAADEAVLTRLGAIVAAQPPAATLTELGERWRGVGEASKDERALLEYVARALVQGDRHSGEIFRGMLAQVGVELARLEERGLVRPTGDPDVRNLMFTLLDLSSMLLRDHVERELGAPLDGPGAERWVAELIELFGGDGAPPPPIG